MTMSLAAQACSCENCKKGGKKARLRIGLESSELTFEIGPFDLDPANPSSRGPDVAEPYKFLKHFSFALGDSLDPSVGKISNPPSDPGASGYISYFSTKKNALNKASNQD